MVSSSSGSWGGQREIGVLDHLQSDQGSEVELGSSPVSSACIVPDFVVSLVSDPVRHRSVLLDLLGKSNLLSERLNGTLQQEQVSISLQKLEKSYHFLFNNCY